MDYVPIRAGGQYQFDRELRRAILEVIYCHLIFFIVFWLALFAPLYCQYHGLMMHFGDVHHHDASGADQFGNTLRFHQMTSSVMMMTFFVAATPKMPVLLTPADIRRFSPVSVPFPLAALVPVPDQPPRLF